MGAFLGWIVCENLNKSRKERTSWAELFSEFRKGVALRVQALASLWETLREGISVYFLTTFSQKKDQAPAVLDDPQLPPREGFALILSSTNLLARDVGAEFLTCLSRKESAPALLDSNLPKIDALSI
jgi:hypothetical protein